MIRVGLTGNAGSGKTTVADRWREAGIPLIDADRIGHAVLAEDGAAREALLETFGPAIGDATGGIDREALAERAFASDEATARLNAIVHPPLVARLRKELDDAARAGEEVAVVDAALVFEFGFDAELDTIVLVTAPPALREERLRRARGIGRERFERLTASQQPDIEKARRSDYVIVNDGSIEHLEAKADVVLAAIRAACEIPKEGTNDERQQ